jgi:Tfp pilus assembly protein PilF
MTRRVSILVLFTTCFPLVFDSAALWALAGGQRSLVAAFTVVSPQAEQSRAAASAPQQTVPSSARTHLAKGQRALESHDLRAAKSQLKLAIQADPRLAEAFLALGIV